MSLRALLISRTGFLGPRLAAGLQKANVEFHATSRRDGDLYFDLERPVAPQLRSELERGAFTHGILCAAMADLEACFREPARSRRVNVEGPMELFGLFAEFGITPVFFSSDMVFDCSRDYRREDEAPSPTTLYGRQKVETEELVLRRFPDALVFRTSKMMATDADPRNILTPLARAARGEGTYRAFRDQYITPVFVEDVAASTAKALLTGARGLYHLAGSERLSRVELAERVFRYLGAGDRRIEEGSVRDAPVSEPRGNFHTLSAEKARRELGFCPMTLEEGLAALQRGLSNPPPSR